MDEGETIKYFAEEHSESLFTIGILGTLAILLGSLDIGWIGQALSFLMLLAMALVWSEIKMQNRQHDSVRLMFFKWSLRAGFWLIVLYLLLRYRTVSNLFLFMPITILFLYIGAMTLRKSEKVLEYFRSPNISHKILTFFMTAVLMAISLGLGFIFATPANIILDEVAKLNSGL